MYELFELFIPVKPQRLQLLYRKFIKCLFCRSESFEKLNLFANDVVTFLNVIDLGIILIHFVLNCVDFIFVGISKLFVLRPCRQTEIDIIQILPIDLIRHFHCTSGNRKTFIYLVIAGVSNFFKSCILCIIPCLQQVAQIPSVYVSRGQQFVHLILDLLFEFLLKLFVIHLEELLE